MMWGWMVWDIDVDLWEVVNNLGGDCIEWTSNDHLYAVLFCAPQCCGWWTQLCKAKSGTSADPRWSRIVLGYLGCDMNHPHQLHLAEFCAWHLAQVLTNVDMLAIARTIQIVQRDGSPIEDESV